MKNAIIQTLGDLAAIVAVSIGVFAAMNLVTTIIIQLSR